MGNPLAGVQNSTGLKQPQERFMKYVDGGNFNILPIWAIRKDGPGRIVSMLGLHLEIRSAIPIA